MAEDAITCSMFCPWKICITKRSWKDLHVEGIKLESYMRLDLPPLQLLEYFPFVLLGSS